MAAGWQLAAVRVEQNNQRFSYFLLANCRELYSCFFSLQALKRHFFCHLYPNSFKWQRYWLHYEARRWVLQEH